MGLTGSPQDRVTCLSRAAHGSRGSLQWMRYLPSHQGDSPSSRTHPPHSSMAMVTPWFPLPKDFRRFSSDRRVPAELGQESQASSCLRKGTPLASRVAQVLLPLPILPYLPQLLVLTFLSHWRHEHPLSPCTCRSLCLQGPFILTCLGYTPLTCLQCQFPGELF